MTESLFHIRSDVSYVIEVRAPDHRWQLWNTPDSNHAERTFQSIREAHPGLEFRLLKTTETEELVMFDGMERS